MCMGAYIRVSVEEVDGLSILDREPLRRPPGQVEGCREAQVGKISFVKQNGNYYKSKITLRFYKI